MIHFSDNASNVRRVRQFSDKTRNGCRRKYALEASEAIFVSPLERFREGGENQVLDDQEGLATEGTERFDPETPDEAVERRRYADMHEAIELLDSGITRTSCAVKWSAKHVSCVKEWWVF